MSTPRISTDRQEELLAEAARLMRERAATEAEIKSELDRQSAEHSARFDAELEQLVSDYEREAAELDETYVQGLEKARHRYETDSAELRSDCARLTRETTERFDESRRSAELNWRQTRALLVDSFETEKKAADELGDQTRSTVAGYEDQLVWLEQQTQLMLRRRGLRLDGLPPSTLNVEESTALLVKRYSAAAKQAHARLEEVTRWRTTRFLDDGWPLLIFFVVLVGSAIALVLRQQLPALRILAVSAGLATALSLVSRQALQWLVRRQARGPLTEMQAAFVDAQNCVTRAKVTVEREHVQRHERLQRRHELQLEQADATYRQIASDLEREAREKQAIIDHRLSASSKQLEARWDAEARPYREEFPPRIEQRKQAFKAADADLAARRKLKLHSIQAEYDARWAEMADRFTTGMQTAAAEVAAMREYCDATAVDFASQDWSTWQPENKAVSAIRFGEFVVDLATLEGGLPTDPRLALAENQWSLPATLAFPESPSLLIEATDSGRDQAIRVMRNVMLRMLTLLPAGKVRFTIIDPTGLGQNFSEFMHLADYDERLVSSRIWTEANHINQRLADLTEHMENVIQKYLRNEFGSIQEYNAKAGEVAEAFQVLVVANFPANFAEETARRLVSIATSGARCGVYTLISTDMKMALPRNFDLSDLEVQANTIVWEDDHFRWRQDALRRCELQVDLPVEGETLTEIVRAAGEQAKDANRVEVPFAAVTPAKNVWWTYDSRQEIQVPLGRAGATKLQTMHLGKGTAQHVLISGKTGSGKSTLMHAMITNLAIHYSPRELEFFLVDFKKGVEFKTYAQLKLPHARVVAIESEREFGMSVLERLDEELRRRGDLFREAGVQSVAAYRDIRPDEQMPRQLLIVDEFQEFFVKDDKIAQDASLLLDRLVRQGRAFGIHVLLGSQTLAGAYSLARSTLGQMAVRIALQCSEADAHLILSEDNTAARLLSRPGEAIYNNANGLFEGNHPFQVVWLPDHEREKYLRDLADLARERELDVPPAIVFEGNLAADPAQNLALRQALQAAPADGEQVSPKAWLGSAIAIKEPTHAIFRRQAGSNLLIVGQKEELAAGVLGGCLISLAASQPRRDGGSARAARILVLDGGGFEAVDIGIAQRLAKRLPLDIEAVANANVDVRLAEIAAAVTERLESGQSSEPIYLAIYNLARFRSLRKSDDDFGFSSFSDEEPAASPAQNLVHILREGPSVGVHVLMWCDTYNNVTRWMERATLRDIAHRVLFQMSATDSSNLMDSAAASHLGAFRAIYYNDEQGDFERFRPYQVPTSDWLAEVSRLLETREVDTQLPRP